MNIVLRYFKYQFVKTIIPICILIVLFSTFTYKSLFFPYYSMQSSNTISYYFSGDSLFGCLLITAIVMATFVFDELNNRRNIDALFSVSLSKTKIVMTKLVVGGIGVYIVALALSAVQIVGSFDAVLETGLFETMQVCFLIIGISLMIYLFASFAFCLATNTVDGLMFIGMFSVYPMLIARLILLPFWSSNDLDKCSQCNFFSPLINLYSSYEDRINSSLMNEQLEYSIQETLKYPQVSDIVELVIIFLVTIACPLLIYITYKKKRAEDIGGVSKFIFGYPVFLPLAFIVPIISSRDSSVFGVEYTIFSSIALYVGYLIFRRGLRLKIQDYISMASVICIAILYMSVIFFIF